MDAVAVLQQAHEIGLAVWLDGTDLQVEGPPTPEAMTVLDDLRECKAEVVAHLTSRAGLIDLPFPIGYGGLPAVEVARAEASNTRLGITDPVEQRLNVLSWMRGYFHDMGDANGSGKTHYVAESPRPNYQKRSGKSCREC